MAKNVTAEPFEATVKALRPFMMGYGITSDKELKLRIAEGANIEQLNTVITSAGERVRRSGNAVFVRFDGNNQDVKDIAERVFGESRAE